MNVNSLDQLKAALEAAVERSGSAANSSGGEVAKTSSFGATLDGALKEVSAMQDKSAELQKSFQRGDPTVSLEQTMVAMQNSQVAFQSAVTVRNRLVAAYTEIMNMQV